MSKRARAEKIKILLAEGYPQKQAIAIAYSMIPEKKKRATKPSPYRREGLRAYEAQQRARGGSIVNPTINEPSQICEPLDGEMCGVCGEFYHEVTLLGKSGIDRASRRIRRAAGGWNKGGGYRTRGPLLWAMHVEKMEMWYERHLNHCMIFDGYESLGLEIVPIPPSIIWVESFGNSALKKLGDKFGALYSAAQDDPFRNYESMPLRPDEYTHQMKQLLKKIRLLIDRSAEKNRRRKKLPSRIKEGQAWDQMANEQLRPALTLVNDREDLPF